MTARQIVFAIVKCKQKKPGKRNSISAHMTNDVSVFPPFV